jgi:HTH domain
MRVIETDYKQTRAFDEIGLRRGVAIVLVNHASKRKVGEWIDPHEVINRSNTALAGASGSIALVDPPDADPLDTGNRQRILAIRGRDLKDDTLLAVHQESPHFVCDGVYIEVRQSRAERELMEAIEDLMPQMPPKQYISSAELADTIGCSRAAVRQNLSRMQKKGHVFWKDIYRLVVRRGKDGGVRLDPRDKPPEPAPKPKAKAKRKPKAESKPVSP